MAASNPRQPTNLPGSPPAADEFEARLMREQAQSQPLLPRRSGSRPRFDVIAGGRKAGRLAGTAVHTVTQIRARVPELKQRMQDLLQDRTSRIRNYAYENPLYAVLGAAAAGFVIGFLLRVGRPRRG